MLQYDNQAWNFFALAWLSLYLLPSWWSIKNKVVKAIFGTKDAEISVARTLDEKKKSDALKKSSKGLHTLSTGFWINFIITIIFTFIFIYIASSISDDGEVNSFDPYSILEVNTGSDMKAIKKAYKMMSLKWHPDKNPNNPAAEAKFMMVAKAYEALTDPVAKENYEKYGNPDGKQSLEVSIGLPSWLLNPESRNLVLMVYLIIMVGIIPFCVWKYYSNSSLFGEKDVMYDTYSWFHHSLDEHTMIKSLPETLAGSAEFRTRNMPKSSKEKDDVKDVMNQLRSQMPKPKYMNPICVKGNVLIHAHLCRLTNLLSEDMKSDLNYMLQRSNSLIEAMISVCQHQDGALKSAMNCITFGQNLTQACWLKDNTLKQLPHFTENEMKHVMKGKTGVKNLEQYAAIANDDKKGLNDLTEEQKADVFKCCDIIPNITLKSKIFVDDDEDAKVYEGDLCTVRVNVTRNNLKEGEKAGLVHAPHFPFPQKEAFWVILGTKDGKIISIEKVMKPAREFEHDIKFLAPRQGNYVFDLHVMSNGYIGVDKKDKIELQTLDPALLPEFKVHPDDAELDDEPTLFEEILNANVEDDSDSEDEDDDEDEKEEPIKELTAAERKKMELQKRRKAAAGDDSDDDSSVEEIYAD